MDNLDNENEEATVANSDNRPGPENFDLFLPWACRQMQLDFDVAIINVLSKFAENKTGKSRLNLGKLKTKKSEVLSELGSIKSISLNKIQPIVFNEKLIRIYTVYDNLGNLLQLKFDQNKIVPRKVLQIIGLITHYHKYLTNITINRGLNIGCLHELVILSYANITDICLDNTGNGYDKYEILLEKRNNLKQLSVSRCKIEDSTVKKMASKLVHPMPASLTLTTLNLASNNITDVGAQYLALALRTNRSLVYLNLSDNSLGDDGVAAIFDVLMEFPLTNEELLESRSRHYCYLREKNELIAQITKELKSTDVEKRNVTKKQKPPKKYKDEKETEDSELWLEKAEYMAETKLGEFREPFYSESILHRNGLIYCKGNYNLAYINLSYNHLAYLSLKKILSVLKYQKMRTRRPRGLVNLNIEGNCMPSACSELTQIDYILSSYFGALPKRMSIAAIALKSRQSKI